MGRRLHPATGDPVDNLAVSIPIRAERPVALAAHPKTLLIDLPGRNAKATARIALRGTKVRNLDSTKVTAFVNDRSIPCRVLSRSNQDLLVLEAIITGETVNEQEPRPMLALKLPGSMTVTIPILISNGKPKPPKKGRPQ